MLSQAVVAEDARLERLAERSRLELARYRWHWTLDLRNEDRIAIPEYARQVSRHVRTIDDMVTGYRQWTENSNNVREFSDYLARAKLRGDDRHATEAVAAARGIGVETARRHHAPEIREVKATAQERAERRGTTVENEIGEVAQARRKVQNSREKVKAEEAKAHTIRYIEAEGLISVAMRNLRHLLDTTRTVEFSDDEQVLLADSLNRLKALLNLLEVQLVGAADVDWDKEMGKLTGGLSA